jgi:hypothetical protein
MQMLTSPSSVVHNVLASSSPTSLNNPSADHRPLTSSALTTVAISPEEVAMRMLDYYTVCNRLYYYYVYMGVVNGVDRSD